MNENIGNFLKKLRKEKGMTQDDLADLIPTDRSNISRWERNNVTIPLNQMERICEIFNLQFSELLIGERINENNVIESNKKIIKNIENNKKKFRVLLISSIIVLVLLIITVIMFLLYYFFETYNTESVYKIYVDSDKYNITDGILVITRENIYFKIGTINDKNLHFVLYKNDELRFSGDSNSLLIDFYGYDQYFDTKTLKKDLDKYYIDIENNKYKLKFERIYNNKNLIQEKNDKISEETDNAKSNELYIPQKIKDLFKCDEMLCEYQDKKEKYVYINGTNELTILKDDGYLTDDFKSNIFSGTVDGKNIYIENGRIECNDDCDFQKKIYEKYYVKVKEKFWK